MGIRQAKCAMEYTHAWSCSVQEATSFLNLHLHLPKSIVQNFVLHYGLDHIVLMDHCIHLVICNLMADDIFLLLNCKHQLFLNVF